MLWIQKISSILKTWVFKNKVLKFSSKYKREPMACFFCPEMCRFSCAVAETVKSNTVTPRGKMSLLHLREKGVPDSQVVQSAESRTWFLEQCTGCGRCTEFCLHEIDVATELRHARHDSYKEAKAQFSFSAQNLGSDFSLEKVLFLCEPGREEWWRKHPDLLGRLSVKKAFALKLPAKEWLSGKLDGPSLLAIAKAFDGAQKIWVESPELAWFLAKGLRDEAGLKAEVRVVWQEFFGDFSALELRPEHVFHESYFYSRLLPRLGYSIPMYERGLMPFHSGWNVIDSGAEGFFQHLHAETSAKMAQRFLEDLTADGRKVDKILCQSLDATKYLQQTLKVKTSYWLDEVFD